MEEENPKRDREGRMLAARLLLWTGVRRGCPASQLGLEGVLLWAKPDFSTIAPWVLAPGVTNPDSRSRAGRGEAERVPLKKSEGL